MADTKEQLDINFNVTGLEQATAQLKAANASVEKLFRTLSDKGEEIETPFKKSLDSTNRLKGDLDAILDQFKVFGSVGNNVASALEEISDPILRAKAAADLLGAAIKSATSEEAKLAASASIVVAKLELQNGSTNSLLESISKINPAMAEAAGSLAGIADATKRAAAAAQLFATSQRPLTEYQAKLADLADSAKLASTKIELQNYSTKSLLESISKINPRFAESVGHINNIGDAQKRASAASTLFAKSQAPVGKLEGAFSALGDKVNAVKAKWASLPPLMQSAILGAAGAAGAAAGAILALASAVGSKLVDAWKAWAAQSNSAQQAQNQLLQSYDQLQSKVGKIIEQHTQLTTTMYGAAAAMDTLSDAASGVNDSLSEVTGPLSAVFYGLGLLSEGARDQLRWVNPLYNAYERLGGWLEFWGQLEKKRIDGLKDFNETTDIVTSTVDRLASSSIQAGSGLDTFEKAMQETQVEAWKLNQALDELDKRWSDSAFGAQNAVGSTTERGGSAISKSVVDLDKLIEKNNKLQNEIDRDRENSYKFFDFEQKYLSDKVDKQLFYNQLKLDELAYNKLLREESGADLQITNAQAGVEQVSSTLSSVQSNGVTPEEYKKVAMEFLQARAQIEAALANPLITPDEALFLEEKVRALEAKFLEFKTKFKDASEVGLNTSSIDAATASMNEAIKGSIMLGASMAGMALETLIAGDALSNFGLQALQMFGNFASNAGQVILATGIGQLALFQGNPGGAIAAGLSLIALGSVLGGIAKRNLKKDGASGGGAAQANQIADRFAQNNRNSEQEPQPIIVYAQFGTERLEPAIAHAYTNAQRNGRLPRN